jgi:cytidine deaminase
MKEKLIKLLDNSYSPYSKFRVASIVIMKDGREFNGVNVENASYGAAICAERSAIVSAISAGYKKGDFKELYVMCDSPKISSSCFICRQVISEFFNLDDKVTFMSNLGEQKTYIVKEICPVPFNEEDLI